MLLMCCRLKELGLLQCDNLTDRGLLEGIGPLQRLTSLCLSCGFNLTAQGLYTFLHGTSMTSIVSLNLSCPNLDDEGLKGIAERCNKLTYLHIWKYCKGVCVCLCEVSLLCVCVYRCVHLKELDVSFCYKITDTGISNVITRCTQLCVLNLMDVKSITGLCAVCNVPEPSLCFITLAVLYCYSMLITDYKARTLVHIDSQYYLAHIHNISLLLNCRACCNHTPSVTSCISLSQYCMFICCTSSICFSVQN
jgi:hypothetical protein